MAGGAVWGISIANKLASMDVLVASVANCWNASKCDQDRALADHRLMALQARDRTVRAQQVEFRLGVIECRGFLPRTDVVADFATPLRVRGGVALMRIAMTIHARHRAEVISLGGRRRGLLDLLPMALSARRRNMPAEQLKARLLMPCERER